MKSYLVTIIFPRFNVSREQSYSIMCINADARFRFIVTRD